MRTGVPAVLFASAVRGEQGVGLGPYLAREIAAGERRVYQGSLPPLGSGSIVFTGFCSKRSGCGCAMEAHDGTYAAHVWPTGIDDLPALRGLKISPSVDGEELCAGRETPAERFPPAI